MSPRHTGSVAWDVGILCSYTYRTDIFPDLSVVKYMYFHFYIPRLFRVNGKGVLLVMRSRILQDSPRMGFVYLLIDVLKSVGSRGQES